MDWATMFRRRRRTVLGSARQRLEKAKMTAMRE
jgi:hypothetical protein